MIYDVNNLDDYHDPFTDSFLANQMDYMYQEDTPASNEKDLVRTSDTNRGGPDYINGAEDDEFMLVNSMKKRE